MPAGKGLTLRVDSSQLSADMGLLADGLMAFDAGAISLPRLESRNARKLLDRLRSGKLDELLPPDFIDCDVRSAGSADCLTVVVNLDARWSDLLTAFRAEQAAIDRWHSRAPE